VLEPFGAEASGRAVKAGAVEELARNLFSEEEQNAPRVMDTATLNEMDRVTYFGKLMALIQLYLEFNLSVTDAILAAESDLVTWKTLNPDFRPLSNRRRLNRADQSVSAEGQV
jgi:hypothetical protein